MAKPILVRKSFNAGELSPELHFRDDLAAYVKGCKHLTNMAATPYGAVTRRPPMELLAKIDESLYGIPIRYIPFKFSLTEVFHIIFTDGSGSETTDSTTADLIIFDSNGSQVIFDGTPGTLSSLPGELPVTLSTGFVAMVTTVYDPADLNEIHFINVNDFVYLTCGGKYPVQIINRFFDIDEGGNRWKIEAFKMTGGPWSDPNLIASNPMSVTGGVYDVSRTYSADDRVFPTNTGGIFVTGLSWLTISYGGCGQHNIHFDKELKLEVNFSTSHGKSVGDFVTVSGIRKGGSLIDGTYTVYKVNSSTKLTLNYGYPRSCYDRDWDPASLSYDSGASMAGLSFLIYRSKLDDNLGNAVTNTTYWEVVSVYFGDLNLSCGSDVFSTSDIGRKVRVRNVGYDDLMKGSWVVSTISESFALQGTLGFRTEGGTWSGVIKLEESRDFGSTWESLGQVTSVDSSSNGSFEREVTNPESLIRVNFERTAGTCKWVLTAIDSVYVYAEITEYINNSNVKAKSETPITNIVSDSDWSLGAFSETTGYPHTLTIHDERIVFGGSKEKPNTVWTSRVNSWDNFIEGNTETSPYTFTIASDSFDTIRSLKSSRQLNILTDNAENTMGSRDDNAITSITNISVSSHTNYGSNQTQAIQMADMIWFVMGQSERVRATRYDFASDGQQSIEMSLFASHITASGIKEMSFRRHPFNTLFCLLNNGTAAALTYEGMQEVKAWSTYATAGGDILSAASNYSDEGDIVAGIVKRGSDYFLEVFGSNDAQTVFLDNQTQWTDQDFTIGQPIEQTDDGLLVVIRDDAVLVEGDDYTIAGGLLTIPGVTTGAVTIGRAFESRVNPTDISEVAPSGMVKRLTELGLYLLDSGTCTVKINGKESPFTDGRKLGAGDRISGLFDMETGGDYDQGLDIDITIDNHRHFTLTGLGYRLSVSDG